MARPYNSAADYHLILATARKERTLTAIKKAFIMAGLDWPFNFNCDGSAYALMLDHDICRAWDALRAGREDEPCESITSTS